MAATPWQGGVSSNLGWGPSCTGLAKVSHPRLGMDLNAAPQPRVWAPAASLLRRAPSVSPFLPQLAHLLRPSLCRPPQRPQDIALLISSKAYHIGEVIAFIYLFI